MAKSINAALVAMKQDEYNKNWSVKKPGDIVYFDTTRSWYKKLVKGAKILVRVQGTNDVLMLCEFMEIKNIVGKKFDLELGVIYNGGETSISAKRVYEFTKKIKAGAEFGGFNGEEHTWTDIIQEFK